MPRSKAQTESLPDPKTRLMDAALALAERQGWRRTTLAEIAVEAGVSLDVAYRACPSKRAILEGVLARIDQTMLRETIEADSERPRDRLFDLIMRRFDVLQSRRQGYRSMLRDSFGDPEMLTVLPVWLRSMTWMLEAAGIGTAGWRGHLRVHAVAGVYVSVLRTYFADDSPDLTRTMAVLDRRLRACERLLGAQGSPPPHPETPPG